MFTLGAEVTCSGKLCPSKLKSSAVVQRRCVRCSHGKVGPESKLPAVTLHIKTCDCWRGTTFPPPSFVLNLGSVNSTDKRRINKTKRLICEHMKANKRSNWLVQYSGPLNGTGLNCEGPFIHGFFPVVNTTVLLGPGLVESTGADEPLMRGSKLYTD